MTLLPLTADPQGESKPGSGHAVSERCFLRQLTLISKLALGSLLHPATARRCSFCTPSTAGWLHSNRAVVLTQKPELSWCRLMHRVTRWGGALFGSVVLKRCAVGGRVASTATSMRQS